MIIKSRSIIEQIKEDIKKKKLQLKKGNVKSEIEDCGIK